MLLMKFYESPSLLINDGMDSTHRKNPLNSWLCVWHECLFSLKEDRFPMSAKFCVPKIASAPGIHKLSIPHVFTAHAMGVIRDGEEVPLCAHTAAL